MLTWRRSASVGTQFARACVDRAEGNPLFLEQLLRNAEEGAITELPGTIQSLVLARLDRLPVRDRRALQAAAVLGQRFPLYQLRAVAEDSNSDYQPTRLLAGAQLRIDGDAFLFAHALVQKGV